MWDMPMMECGCGAEWTVRVLGQDGCGNWIVSVRRPRTCCCNGNWVPCKRYR